jgi:hypothetical protein
MSWTSPITALSHLSDEAVAAFADGVLSDTARQRAQSHMAGCAECSEAVYGQRAARAALRSALSPRLPAGLFERLRELPITAELPLVLPAALSADGRPLFAPAAPRDAVATELIAVEPVAVEPVAPLSVPAMAPFPAPVPSDPHVLLAAAAHRRASARVGIGATAVAVLAVGVLATTAANAGGVPPVSSSQPAGQRDQSHSTIARGTTVVDAPMQMTLLSVPSSGR